ncbi:MAG: Unknown protein [uncultured Sulfurovum sp.]|uniref:AMIN domain-containing protein n=1 Tax=uncultured Sulfurovum sp. TaxID=269237 RepID=A0A6S6SU12_9BACT|nr:MAG: Unknown protein [uncultured Sulfurovum sp.]
MKKSSLLLIFSLLFLGCETGTRYDKNATTQKVPRDEPQSGMVSRSIEDLLEDRVDRRTFDEDEDRAFIEESEPIKEVIKTFSNSVSLNGLNVEQIREGIHDDYIRLVFDISKGSKPAYAVGSYDAKHNVIKKEIEVTLHGYKSFSAPLPSFSSSSEIEQIHFEQYPEDRGFKFYIQLRKEADVRIFDLKNPARLVFDIKAI